MWFDVCVLSLFINVSVIFWQICMGSGACVRVRIYTRYMNLYVDAIAEDWDKTSGLCGTYNGNRNDDFYDPDGNLVSCSSNICRRFSDQWRVPDEDNLFKTPISNVQSQYDVPKLCKCQEQGGQKFHCGPAVTSRKTGNNAQKRYP